MKFLSRKLAAIGFKCTIIKSKGTGPKPALNLYARFGKSKPHINFLGHTDVVTNLDNWSVPPFKGTIKNGQIISRGIADMKGSIACWISAVSNFTKNKKLKGSDNLSNEEIKTIIQESSNKITENYEEMVLNLLDLQQVTVEHAMIPKNDVEGIDINDPIENINKKLIDINH